MKKWISLILIILLAIQFTLIQHSVPTEDNVKSEIFKGMVKLPEGCFNMGDSEIYVPEYKVCLDTFYISKTEVTQSQWRGLMGNNPSYFENCGNDCPVEEVSWEDVQIFIKKLNHRAGTKKYRLPTAAEWEYACRGGKDGQKYCGSNSVDSVAWYEKNSGITTHPVSQKQANGFGLYDMSGNVREWLQDRDVPHLTGSAANPKGANAGLSRIVRGGCWNDWPYFVRSAYQYGGLPDSHNRYIGFRLLMNE